jgi:serine protease Do
MVPGDAILSVNGKTINRRDELIEAMIGYQPDQTIDLEISHEEKKDHRKLTIGGLPDALPPAALPPACEKRKTDKAKGPQTGTVKLKIPQFANDIFAYVPENYDSSIHYGLVVWLHGEDGLDWDKTLSAWQSACIQYNLILAAPKSSDSKKWNPREVELVNQLIEMIDDKYSIDPQRIMVHGQGSGGILASFVANRNRERIRAMALVNTPLTAVPQENDPQYRFAVYIAAGENSQAGRSLKKIVAILREMHVPLTVKNLGEEPRYLNSDELGELARWIDMLDRI